MSLTLDGSQDDAGVVVGDDVGVTIFGLVHLQVGVFPGELLAWIDGLMGEGAEADRTCTHKEEIRRVEQYQYDLNVIIERGKGGEGERLRVRFPQRKKNMIS